MPYSRISRIETRKERKRLKLAIIGMVGIILLVAIFGVNILIGFSVMVDSIRGGTPTPTPGASLILPPTLDPPVQATNSATITLTGKGQPDMDIIIYLNDAEFKEVSIPTDGNFSIVNIPLSAGVNTISAKLSDSKGAMSELSNVVTVTYANKPPTLDISSPDDNITVNGEPNTVTVSGSTDDNCTVTINDRFVVVRSDNSFSYDYPLNEGDNELTIVSTDAAGNQTKVIRKIVYHR